jgi:3-hydroxybutyryl-CoA dehydrogenase
MDIEHIVVVGAGQMGAGIAQVALTTGFKVTLVDAMAPALEKGKSRIEGGLAKLVEKGKLDDAGRKAALSRLSTAGAISDARGAQAGIEAVTENEELKKKIFKELDAVIAPGGIIASNTSSISITRIATATARPDAVVGMHFMNPVPLMALVELIRGAATSEATYTATRAMAEKMGKTVVVSKDMPGFIVNRILIPMLNEACFVLQEGIATAADTDAAMKLGTNVPMGPLTLADFIGLDTCLSIAEVLHKGLGEDKYRPAPLLRQMVDAGWLGKKTGRGFHTY